MKKLLFTGGLLFGTCASFAQSAPAPITEAVMDTAVFEAFCRSMVATDSARRVRPAPPCPYAPKGHPPACVDGHREHIIPIVYGLSSSPELAMKFKRGEVWPGGCFVTDCSPYYYCTLHGKKL
jgi:hypothetical protein